MNGTVDIDRTGEALQELDFTVAVGGVEIGDYLIPKALCVFLWVVEMKFQRIHVCVESNYYMFIDQYLGMLLFRFGL